MDDRWNSAATLFFWLSVFLLIPWVPMLFVSGMAFDAGNTIEAYVYITFFLSYPVTVIIAALMKERKPAFAFLPLASICGVLTSALFHVSQ
jgi:hypothetical protein